MEHSIMADVNIYRCFSTIIYEFKYHPPTDEYNNMKTHISEIMMKKSDILHGPDSRHFGTQTPGRGKDYHSSDNLHKLPNFIKLKETISDVAEQICNMMEYQYDELEITGMWSNTLQKGDAHAPHTHSNNFLSGVYYLKSDEKSSPIQFFDPRAQATVLRPRNKPNWDNGSMVGFNAIQGVGFIFPSWLMHWVPPTQGERISISWNIIVRGPYGEPNTLQNAYI